MEIRVDQNGARELAATVDAARVDALRQSAAALRAIDRAIAAFQPTGSPVVSELIRLREDRRDVAERSAAHIRSMTTALGAGASDFAAFEAETSERLSDVIAKIAPRGGGEGRA